MPKHLSIISTVQLAVVSAFLLASCNTKVPDEPIVKPDPDKPIVEPDGNVYGRVQCGGVGIPGVVVTDGYLVTTTDDTGAYALESEKKNKLVWISIPSGYCTSNIGVQAQFYQNLTKNASTAEKRNFELFRDKDQTKHTMLVFGDMHLANRYGDREFPSFTADVSNYLSEHSSENIYALTLGDMTWDQYWYSNNYYFNNYLADINAGIKGLTIFHAIGNHDHNMKTSVNGSVKGWDAVDWDTAGAYRNTLGPNYYSFNIGQIHYVMLDNIYCRNSTGGTSDDRKYDTKVCADCLAWLKKDLAYVDKATPVVAIMHSPLYDKDGASALADAGTFTACFDGFSDVTFLTGHSHNIWNVDKGRIREFNSGSVCACWWWCGYYDPAVNIARDGSPGGYRIMNYDGKKLVSSVFKGTGHDVDYQFRAYDRNSICVSSAGVNNAAKLESTLSKYGGYNKASSSNEVLLNVWDWDKNWNIEVTENGKSLKVTQ
ncbi:MAG: calcineurin-like phosphoesterase family protein, partial [Bacteroidales bacterium]|nr:calcineurin-like phosphoesterase family protein [Bacteroidales bacterium]